MLNEERVSSPNAVNAAEHKCKLVLKDKKLLSELKLSFSMAKQMGDRRHNRGSMLSTLMENNPGDEGVSPFPTDISVIHSSLYKFHLLATTSCRLPHPLSSLVPIVSYVCKCDLPYNVSSCSI